MTREELLKREGSSRVAIRGQDKMNMYEKGTQLAQAYALKVYLLD